MNCIPVRTAQSIENFARIGSVFLQEYKGSSGGEFKTVGVKQKNKKQKGDRFIFLFLLVE
jgi:hypothetical protein